MHSIGRYTCAWTDMCYGTVPPIIRLVARTRSIRSSEYNDAHCRRQCLPPYPIAIRNTVHCHRVEGAPGSACPATCARYTRTDDWRRSREQSDHNHHQLLWPPSCGCGSRGWRRHATRVSVLACHALLAWQMIRQCKRSEGKPCSAALLRRGGTRG
jgi:hypothetical protein